MKARGHKKGNRRRDYVGTGKNLEEGYRKKKNGLKGKEVE